MMGRPWMRRENIQNGFAILKPATCWDRMADHGFSAVIMDLGIKDKFAWVVAGDATQRPASKAAGHFFNIVFCVVADGDGMQFHYFAGVIFVGVLLIAFGVV